VVASNVITGFSEPSNAGRTAQDASSGNIIKLRMQVYLPGYPPAWFLSDFSAKERFGELR
jgi:hypothetical protein